jgi:hypothetical protein
LIPTPQLPLFRITLFYGPDTVADDPLRLSCVFNVKKRSWKGGVQIAVEIDGAQLTLIKQRINFEAWLKDQLSGLPASERAGYEGRACDLLVQEVCSIKLSLALQTDIQQENSRLEASRYAPDVDASVASQTERIKSSILTELDLPAHEDPSYPSSIR